MTRPFDLGSIKSIYPSIITTTMQIYAKGFRKSNKRSIFSFSPLPSDPLPSQLLLLQLRPSECWSPERKRGDGGKASGRMEGGDGWVRLDAQGHRSWLPGPGSFCVEPPSITTTSPIITHTHPSKVLHTHTSRGLWRGFFFNHTQPHKHAPL